MAARTCDLERGDTEVLEDDVVAGERELGPDQHHVHRQPAASPLDEELLGGRHHLGRGASRRVGVPEGEEAVGVDLHALTDGYELRVGLDGAGMVELDIPRDQVRGRRQCGVVADGHHVVEPVDADALPAEPLGQPLARALREHLLLDPRVAVLADVARLGRKNDRRVTFERQQHVRVAMHDREAAQVGHGALEARVLGAADERSIEAVARERLPDVRIAARHLVHEASNPLTSAQMASFNGVGTPRSLPKRTMPPLR